MPAEISCNQFTSFLVSQEPYYDQLILADIRPTDGEIGNFETGQWEAFSPVERTQDRFNAVFPNVTRAWVATDAETCHGTPCDFTEHKIGWGYSRGTYHLEETHYATDLLCFDQMMHYTKAREHFSQIVSDILKPSTNWIMSHFLRKRSADLSGKKWLADANMTDFTYTWDQDADTNEIYIDTSGDPTSKILPQMLMRRVTPLMMVGYLGKQPFKDMPGMIELVTDLDTCWGLDKAIDDANVNAMWRFSQWDAANAYYRYGFSGQLGNYAVRVDPFPLRFNQVAAGRYQLVLPYENAAATVGIKSQFNEDFENALYQFSRITHKRAIQVLVFNPAPVNPEMPYSSRDMGGKWQFVMDNLGEDENGCVIENKRRNKGQFIADFKCAVRPLYVECSELIFHMRERQCFEIEPPCNDDPGYPEQDYDSANDPCDDFEFTPSEEDGEGYCVDANTITCNGVPVVHDAISSRDLATLVDDLNTSVGFLGTWSLNADEDGIVLNGSPCTEVEIPWVTCAQ